MKIKTTMITLALTFGLLPVMLVPAHAGESTAGTKIGILDCKTVPHSGFSLLIHSTVDVKCDYRATDGSGTEHYIGETGVGLGIDLNYDREQRLAYTVLAADFKSGSYKLAGKYYGAGGSATVGVGLGAQVLIGGNNDSISLQPVLEGSTGFGTSAGFTYLFIQPAPQ